MQKCCSKIMLAGMMILFIAASRAQAAELIMVQRDGCPWCAAFDRDIAPAYGKTDEGRRAPLRRVEFNRALPADLSFLTLDRFTPEFILVDSGREVGRIRGYPGPEGFWTQLSMLVRVLGPEQKASAARTDTQPIMD